MGQQCSCWQRPRRKLARRSSDDMDTLDAYDDRSTAAGLFDETGGRHGYGHSHGGDSDGSDGVDIVIDGDGSSSFVSEDERDCLLPATNTIGDRIVKRKTSKMGSADSGASVSPPELSQDETGADARLLGDTGQAEPLGATDLRPNLEALRSYQRTTGIVDHGQVDLECVMCLDTFSLDNPKMRTLCKCGMNRTNFHLSCLLEWLNRDANCPVCREYLFYEAD